MFGSIFPEVLRIVERWDPKKLTSEAKYRDDLLKLLRTELNKKDPFGMSEKHSIRKESGRHLADIGINNEVGIELKYNLNSKSKVDRLFGQIDDYLKGYSSMVIVLCGKTNEEQLDYLEEKVRNMPSNDLFSSNEVKIIVKNGKRKRKKKDPYSFFGT